MNLLIFLKEDYKVNYYLNFYPHSTSFHINVACVVAGFKIYRAQKKKKKHERGRHVIAKALPAREAPENVFFRSLREWNIPIG